MGLAVLVCTSIVGNSFGMTVKAADIAEIPSTEVESVYDLPVDSNAIQGWPQGPQIYSESGIVMDMDSGAILYAKKIDDKHYPASITKVMTALVALQNYEMDETVSFTWDDVGFLEYGDAHIGIKPEEEVGMEDCMYGMLLASANEVSHAIGAHMEGGYDEFLRVMNETAKELGCQNSNWMNTHGLHDPEHYTSCRDMALIGSAVFQYDKFREITNTYQHTIPFTNITNETRTFQQNHDMIKDWSSRYYEYCVGGKTGYTDQALTTLVTFATKKDANQEDVNLVAVVMRTHGGGGNAYIDTRAILDYAFNNFSKVKVTEDAVRNVNESEKIAEKISEMEEGAYIMLPNGISLESIEQKTDAEFQKPVELGDKTGEITYMYGTTPVGSAKVTITEEFHDEIHGIKDIQIEENEKKSGENKLEIGFILKIIIIIFAAAVIGFFVFLRYISYKRKMMRKRRRKRRMQQKKTKQLIKKRNN